MRVMAAENTQRRAACNDPPPLEIRRRGEGDQLPKGNFKANARGDDTAQRGKGQTWLDHGPIEPRRHFSKLDCLQLTLLPEF